MNKKLLEKITFEITKSSEFKGHIRRIIYNFDSFPGFHEMYVETVNDIVYKCLLNSEFAMLSELQIVAYTTEKARQKAQAEKDEEQQKKDFPELGI